MRNILFTSIVAPQQVEAMCQLAATTPPGAFCEVGVYRGGSAAKLYDVALAQGRELHLFDTFRGTPVHVPGLDHHKVDNEFEALDTPGLILAHLPTAKVHVGIYPATHPEDLGDVAFIHCDCDQYDSYRGVIDRMWPCVVPGGILLFDDYPYLAGAKKAVEESFLPGQLRPCLSRFYVIKGV